MSSACTSAGGVRVSSGTITATQPQPTDIEFTLYGFNVGYEFQSFELRSRSSYIDYNSDNYFDVAPLGPVLGVTFPEVPGYPPLEHNVLTARVFSEEINLASRQLGPWHWTAGASYRDAKDLDRMEEWRLPRLVKRLDMGPLGALARRIQNRASIPSRRVRG